MAFQPLSLIEPGVRRPTFIAGGVLDVEVGGAVDSLRAQAVTSNTAITQKRLIVAGFYLV